MFQSFAILTLLAVVSACVDPKPPVTDAVAAQKKADETPFEDKTGSKMTPVETRKQEEEAKRNCAALKVSEQPPFFVKSEQIVVTRIGQSCETEQGQPGFARNTSWMAMGFPCTGGGGNLEYRENAYNPKIVSFTISNNCDLKPAASDTVMQYGVQKLGIGAESSLLAYYPLAVQYWELVDFEDADVGYVVTLRSQKSRAEGWKNFFNKKTPIKLRLFGRENAWVKDNRFYQADAQLLFNGRDRFTIEVLAAKALSEDESKEVQKRCEALRPQRPCQTVFPN